ncbi:aminotransferase class III-fold pyridoxal phosphate-dependent enzyme [Bacillus thuringiensis]|uniref:aspartate aminotransferase family protein n=1 Tax=Bacillus thuringiensis TaxID=1428 RepID=UPI000E4AE6BC|nr:aminotransferase class III-fold pyridoxal phosphate-dependent enzyme [Bacillus thuringiensis]MDZ3956916.1 aminotransferase class III-fold pyridoxal phosphate-dependent enzyme [Bacillus thuringiensis]RGP42343.1 aspartate aminotransferase family protein [Bacillus thuringiensis]
MDALQVTKSRKFNLQLYQECVNRGFARLADLMQVPLQIKSDGAYIYDEENTRYLDCGGYGVFLMGHSHPRVVKRVKQQLDISSLSNKFLISPETAKAAKALVDITPDQLQYVMFANSGTESVEAALKIARKNNRNVVIYTHKGFHGKTLGALSVTGREEFQKPFAPLLPNVYPVNFGSLDEMEKALKQHKNQAVVILEPLQAEGGVNLPPLNYLKGIRELCDVYGALLVVDEIQTGLGRLGDWWGINQEGITPDILLTGKILSGGIIPTAAAIVKADIFEPFNQNPTLHTSTYAGSPLAMAAIQETIQVLKEEELILKARKLGGEFSNFFSGILSQYSNVLEDIRGKGLLWGIEFKDASLAGIFILGLLKKKIIISNSLNTNKVVRFTPPAILQENEMEYIKMAVQEVLEQMKSKKLRGEK